ncbi:MAG: iron ABC transporter permease [Pseudomonadota bacterium]
MRVPQASEAALSERPRAQSILVLGALASVLAGLILAGFGLGAVAIPPSAVFDVLLGAGSDVDRAILIEIRAPRILLGLAVGATLALSGASLQGLLRNPLADPGLIGVTSGAALGAVVVLVFGASLAAGLPSAVAPFALPAAAFVGAVAVITLLFALARRAGETSVATLILAGVAINAIAGAAIGFAQYVSDDTQLRDLTFWLLGGLGGAGWPLVLAASVLALATVPLFLAHTRALDLFQLGERAAFHAGVDVERAKRWLAFATALGVGGATAAAGPIGFIGLVAPHLARLLVGPTHRLLLPTAALMGMVLVLAADLAVRSVVPPAEPPIGLATSLIGGPFFLWLLLYNLRRFHA